ncbi:MAG: peptidylprolyl isomerase [Acidobacteria bacterium]|nr:peptidylprolyl isomerase [Acidobacteriota bacterium]
MQTTHHTNVFRRTTFPTRYVSALAVLLLALSTATVKGAPWKSTPPKVQATGFAKTAQRPSKSNARDNVPAETLLRIVRAEDERRWEASDLGVLLTDRSAAVRRRAALAAGRIGEEGAVAPLSALLRTDANEGVRVMAAFALGEIESNAGADALIESLRLSKLTEVRARAVEALGKIAAALPDVQVERKRALGEAIIAALETERRQARPDRSIILLGLTAALRAKPANAGKTVALFLSSTDARVRADAANTLTRLSAKESLEQLRRLLASDTDAVVRANAARALGAAEDVSAFDVLMSRATSDADSRVRVSAVRSLAQLKDARAADPLLKRAEDLFASYKSVKTSPDTQPAEMNELLEIAKTLGSVLPNSNHERALQMLRQFRQAGMVAPEVEIALARIAPAQYVRDKALTGFTNRAPGSANNSSWHSVSAFGQGLGEVASLTSAMGGNSFVGLQADAQILLRGLIEDPSTPALALPDLLRSLAAFKPTDLATVMRSKLGAQDVIVRATAADILGELDADAETARALGEALPRALNDEMNDAALSILSALAKQKGDAPKTAMEKALEVTDYIVRRRAANLLRERAGGASSGGRIETVASRNHDADYQRALGRAGKRVRANVSTDKGAFTVELLPEDAPLTVDNFVELARKNYFNGVTFHRVVPNFVIQGGDPRGDGNGGPGYQIRCEINMIPYGRGAVGMALSGKDTGGSQWFVTHSPQPHLDGGYTVFGRVTVGLDVVDRIARGDRIRSVTITEDKPPAQGNQRPARKQ